MREELLRELFGSYGDGSYVQPPFQCDYDYQIHIGKNSFINFGLVALDVGRITIGDDVRIGTNVQLLTPIHPLDADSRRQNYENARPITIGDNAWLGGGVIVCPGVTIGENAVIGAGAVVVKDIPANVVAVGNPAKVVREL